MFVNHPCLSNNMNCIIAPLNGCGGIYLGNLDAAKNQDLLARHQIGAVLSVMDQSVQIKGVQKLWIMADDADDFPLNKYFDQAIKFIDNQTLRTNVLIHCYAGISRSTTLCAAYMMNKYSWNTHQALRHIQSRRRLANPNQGFLNQLQDFEQKLRQPARPPSFSLHSSMTEFGSRKSVGYNEKPVNNDQNRQKDRLSDFNSKLEQFRHQWKIKQRVAY